MTILIIQSRLSSKRLPKKALLPLGEKTILSWVFASMKKVKADRYFLATDYDSEAELKPVAESNGFECFAGPKDDVLKRFCLLIEQTNADTVLRATGDNPFLFSEAATASLERFAELSCDYFTFLGLPHGSGVEVFNAHSLLEAEKHTQDSYDREHVAPALYNHKDKFESVFEQSPEKWNFPLLRTTVDTAKDYRRSQFIAENLKANINAEKIIEYAKKSQKLILFVPSVKKGQGTGHLRRCLSLMKSVLADIYIPKNADLIGLDEFLLEIPDYAIKRNLENIENNYDLVVTDAFSLKKEEIQQFSKIAPLVSIDEGSKYTNYSDYILDIIPALKYKRKSNLTCSGFIPLPEKRRSIMPKSIEKVLIAIGGEDPAGLSLVAAKAFAENGCNVTVLIRNRENIEQIRGVRYINFSPNLKERLYTYDLVVTHYGFTAFESIAAQCGVFLLGTSPLHVKLARNFGFAVLSKNQLKAENIKKLLKVPQKFFPKSKEMIALHECEQRNLAEFICDLADGKKIDCPICSSIEKARKKSPDKVVARFENRTIRKCSSCGMIYLSWSIDKQKQYSSSYFFEDYKKQYGKTYLEDFLYIKSQGIRRCIIIDKIFWKNISSETRRAKSTFPSVLDVGCAYGPFLSAAYDAGWNVFGTDIAAEAVDYVAETLKYKVCRADFPKIDTKAAFGKNHFDALTMWFVIEHFQNLEPVLTKVNSLLKKGGIFAFSTPSASGVSAKFRKEQFLLNSPSDHYSLWQPELCNSILKKFGFKVIKIVSTGMHPERFPYYDKHEFEPKGFMYKLLSFYSSVASLGDTFEIYCIKEKDLQK
ncbi:MAG: methyltransferase domain-containing protein [Treponema sp.]|nr:methyltransferase domain-containing protein [Treponema sp.]